MDKIDSLLTQTNQSILNYFEQIHAPMKERYSLWAEILVQLELYAKYFSKIYPDLAAASKTVIYASSDFEHKEAFRLFFGDHQQEQGMINVLAAKLKEKFPENGLDFFNGFIELLLVNYLISLTIACDDQNLMINKLSEFFDEYINVHEDDYPPYVFHKLCAGAAYGFGDEYFLDPKLRIEMFKLSFATGQNIYKLLHKLITEKTILNKSSVIYRDSVVGDFENGLIPICYQHQAISIEERFWDCMKALRNFVRNYHDRHPLPIIIKGGSATRAKLFYDKSDEDFKLNFIVGLSSIGKHSWDLPLVLRSPIFRETRINKKGPFKTVTCFAPYLNEDGTIKQIYTSFDTEFLRTKAVEFIAPFNYSQEDALNAAELKNEYGYIHALVNLEEADLPKPDITMSAHTHPQYINGFTASIGVPEIWSYLNMQQMYSKTELTSILDIVGVESLKQINFSKGAFTSLDEVKLKLQEELEKLNASYIEDWLLKSSKESGGRGISDKLNIHKDYEEIAEFIFRKSFTDDIVMQEFVPNNAKAFIETDFYQEILDTFIESGISLNIDNPKDDLFFTMRSFQSIAGIKGYLFSVNAANVTVNAGQGAKLFYGEPILIMPPYFANKLQFLLDSYGDMILKKAIPEHAKHFAIQKGLKIYDYESNLSNIYMLNGLFDYIPYIYVERMQDETAIRLKVQCEENCYGGLDYFYTYLGEKIMLCSAKNHQDSINALEDLMKDIKAEESSRDETNIDLDLAIIELNSGLGQANLLQKALNNAADKHGDSRVERFMFDEWIYDLESIL